MPSTMRVSWSCKTVSFDQVPMWTPNTARFRVIKRRASNFGVFLSAKKAFSNERLPEGAAADKP